METNVLNSNIRKNPEVPVEQRRINVTNIPPKSLGERELKDSVLIRKMTTTERDSLIVLDDNPIIFNTTTNKINFYNGSAWEVVTSA